jgi:hypothetical protein
VQEDRWHNANGLARCWSRLYIDALTDYAYHGRDLECTWAVAVSYTPPSGWLSQTTGPTVCRPLEFPILSAGGAKSNPDKVHLIQVTPRGGDGRLLPRPPGRRTYEFVASLEGMSGIQRPPTRESSRPLALLRHTELRDVVVVSHPRLPLSSVEYQ